MEKYNVFYYNDTTKSTKTVTAKAFGIIQAVEVAICEHLELLGWEIVKVEKIDDNTEKEVKIMESELSLKSTYSLNEVIKINRLIDGAISIAEVRGSAAICQGGHCCEVVCSNCPFKPFCCVSFSSAILRVAKDCFNSFIDQNYFQNRNGI